jgi:hypothetical protein
MMYRAMIEDRIDKGIDTAIMQVLRQLPRNTRMSAAVRQAAINASRTTPLMAARTKPDWSNSGVIFRFFGRICSTIGNCASSELTISNVDEPPAMVSGEPLVASTYSVDPRNGNQPGTQEIHGGVEDGLLGHARTR